MNILADSSLPGLYEAFPPPFKLTQYNHPEEIPDLLKEQNILLCRSTLKVNQALLKNHHLNCVATASSGTDHLDHYFLKARNIEIIDAKGCNATAVADYILATLAYLKQHYQLNIKKAGVIGMGMVGTKVSKRLQALNINRVEYDPLKAAKNINFHSCSLEELYDCDMLCIHAELHEKSPFPSLNLIDHQFLSQLKSGCIIINAARGGIVNEQALLNNSKPVLYCTDVYANEPNINKQIIDKATLCTPHIAGHSLDAKFKAVALISEQLHHVAGLPCPQLAQPEKPQIIDGQEITSWDNFILSIYNPITETLALKQAYDTKSAFLNLRKNHQNRHDFSMYVDANICKQSSLFFL
jgi:erythronate-4-phosphate dehydrogenase